ncbi:MAG: GNAT family N-acetyltransferase [Pseudomonadota bacterium]
MTGGTQHSGLPPRTCNEFVLRPIRPEDDAPVAVIIRTVMTEFGAVGEGYSIEDPEVDAMSAAYGRARSACWVVELNARTLGCAGIAPLRGACRNTCELQKMYFLPAARGHGLGSALLQHCLETARGLGYTQCYLETHDTMKAARRLYRRAGFRDIDGPLGATGHCGCDRWMVLDLHASGAGVAVC